MAPLQECPAKAEHLAQTKAPLTPTLTHPTKSPLTITLSDQDTP